MKTLKIIVLVLVFLIASAIGGLQHSLERATGGWIIGGSVKYSYHYGKSYSWEPGYDALNGFWKGSFPEKRCGSLYIDTYEWRTRKPTESNKYMYSEHCSMLMSLSEFIDRYSNGTVVGELRVTHDLPDEGAQIEMFSEWKSEGLLDDIRYKDVTVYDWDNIRDFIWRVLIIPGGITLVVWLLLKFVVFVIKRTRLSKKNKR